MTTSLLKTFQNKNIKIGKIQRQASNSFMLVGSSNVDVLIPNPFSRMLAKLRVDQEKYMPKTIDLLQKIEKDYEADNQARQKFTNDKISIEGLLKNKLIKPDNELNMYIDQNDQKEISKIFGNIEKNIKESETIIEFNKKIIKLYGYNDFSILVADSPTKFEHAMFQSFTNKIEQIDTDQDGAKRFRFKADDESDSNKTRNIHTSYVQKRQRLYSDPKSPGKSIEQGCLNEDIAKVIYPHNKLPLKSSKPKSKPDRNHVPFVRLSSTAQVNFLKGDEMNNYLKVSKCDIPLKQNFASARKTKTVKRKLSTAKESVRGRQSIARRSDMTSPEALNSTVSCYFFVLIM